MHELTIRAKAANNQKSREAVPSREKQPLRIGSRQPRKERILLSMLAQQQPKSFIDFIVVDERRISSYSLVRWINVCED